MKTIVLPGYSIKNKDWADGVKKNLEPEFDVLVHEWKHWEINSSSSLNVSEEIDKITEEIKDEEKINIIAKSIGTLVCMKSLGILKDKINNIILCGIPLNDINEEDSNSYGILKLYDSSKVIILQNSYDPHGNYQQVFSFLNKINPEIKIIKKEADTHEYPFYDDFKIFLS